MSDLIYRRDAVSRMSDLLMIELGGKRLPTWNEVNDAINDLPSAEPERKRGHWINAECKDGTIAHKCSECKCFVGYSVSSLPWYNFCPWCGADMRGGKDATD